MCFVSDGADNDSFFLSLLQSAKNGLGDDNLIPQQLDWPDFLKSVCLYC